MLRSMCGRFAVDLDPGELAEEFDALDLTAGEVPAEDFNVAPTKPVPVVVSRPAGRILGAARWGLVPSWSESPRQAARMINARSETIAVRPTFRSAFDRRRCLVPAAGWYEWAPHQDTVDGPTRRKQAYYLTPTDGSVLAFAGLWEVWGQGPDRLRTCAVVTAPATGGLRAVHDRMPLVLPRERWAAWLGEAGTRTGRPPEELLAPTPADLVAALEVRPVGSEVGDVRTAGRRLTEPLGAGLATRPVAHRLPAGTAGHRLGRWQPDPLPLALPLE